MALLSANLRLMVSSRPAAAAPIPCLVVATLDPDRPPACQAHVIGWPGAKQGAAFMRDLVAAFERQQAAALQATYRLARSVLSEGNMKREMYYETWHGERVLRQRFHATPWEDQSSLTFQSIGGKLSPTQPFGSCAAHESFGDRLSSAVAAFMRQAVEETLAAYPAVKLRLEYASELYEHISSPVEAAVFLPGVWAKWADAVECVVDAVQDRSLLQLCLQARPGQARPSQASGGLASLHDAGWSRSLSLASEDGRRFAPTIWAAVCQELRTGRPYNLQSAIRGKDDTIVR